MRRWFSSVDGISPQCSTRSTIATGSVDLGTLILATAPLELEKLSVKEKRADVELTPDRNSYVVRDMPAAKGGSALDVLKSVPAVDVDIDKVVSLSSIPSTRPRAGNDRGSAVLPDVGTIPYGARAAAQRELDVRDAGLRKRRST